MNNFACKQLVVGLGFGYLTTLEDRPLQPTFSQEKANMKIYMDVRHVNAVHSFYLRQTS